MLGRIPMTPQNRPLLIVALFVATAVHGQMPGLIYERLLLPTVIGQPELGLFGSQWVTIATLTNTAQVPVSVYPYAIGNGGVEPNFTPPLSPNTTIRPTLVGDRPGYRGTFLFVDRAHISDVSLVLRARDLSRASSTYGTAMPVVPEEEFTNGTVSLNDIPVDTNFRSTLRVYSLDSSRATTVRLTLYGVTIDPVEPHADTSLGTVELRLRDLSTSLPANTVAIPGFLEVVNVDEIMPSSFRQLRIDVQPVDGASRIWAFVTVTHNDTQHVTVIAPSR